MGNFFSARGHTVISGTVDSYADDAEHGHPTSFKGPSTRMIYSSASSRFTVAQEDYYCPIKTLPSEIRNRIYELVLFDGDRPDSIELVEAKPPKNDLLLVCHQFYDEAKHMHKAAYREFWSSTTFSISPVRKDTHGSIADKVHDKINALPSGTLSCINSIELHGHGSQAQLRRERGMWFSPQAGQKYSHTAFALPPAAVVERLWEANVRVELTMYGDVQKLIFPTAPDGSPLVEEAMRLMEDVELSKYELKAVMYIVYHNGLRKSR